MEQATSRRISLCLLCTYRCDTRVAARSASLLLPPWPDGSSLQCVSSLRSLETCCTTEFNQSNRINGPRKMQKFERFVHLREHLSREFVQRQLVDGQAR